MTTTDDRAVIDADTFTVRRTSQRELVDEIAGLAEIARKQGPIGLEKVEIADPFLAKGVRYVADGYDADFIRDNLERDRDNFLTAAEATEYGLVDKILQRRSA